MPWLNRRWTIFFAASAVISVVVISVLGFLSFKDGIKKRDKFNAFGVDVNSEDEANFVTNWTSSEPALGAVLSVDSFDPTNKAGSALGFRIGFKPINDLAIENGTEIVPQESVRLLLQKSTVNFPANVVMPIQSIIQVLNGDPNSYPFDVYTVDYTILAQSSSALDPLHLTIFTEGTVQGFLVDTAFQGLQDDGSKVRITITIKRSAILKLFALIIFLIMWSLSLSIFIAAMSVWFREKKVELPVVAISTALLFALPNVRNSQPGIPVAGTTSDMVGFFWNILLVAVSAVSLLINYIIKSQRERPKPPSNDPEHSALTYGQDK